MAQHPNSVTSERQRIAAMSDCDLYASHIQTLLKIFDDPASSLETKASADAEFTSLIADLSRQARAICGGDAMATLFDRFSTGVPPTPEMPWQLQLLVGTRLLLEARALLFEMMKRPRVLH